MIRVTLKGGVVITENDEDENNSITIRDYGVRVFDNNSMIARIYPWHRIDLIVEA